MDPAVDKLNILKQSPREALLSVDQKAIIANAGRSWPNTEDAKVVEFFSTHLGRPDSILSTLVSAYMHDGTSQFEATNLAKNTIQKAFLEEKSKPDMDNLARIKKIIEHPELKPEQKYAQLIGMLLANYFDSNPANQQRILNGEHNALMALGYWLGDTKNKEDALGYAQGFAQSIFQTEKQSHA